MLHLAKPAQLIDIGGGPGWGAAQVQDDLDNMANALARYHGENRARDIMAEAFARAFAKWWAPGGRDIPARFALEVALNQAFDAQRVPATPPRQGGAA